MRALALACVVLLAACGEDGDDASGSHASDSDGDGMFACGSTLQCTADAEYCEVVLGPDTLPLSYHCVELPMECVSHPDCECLAESTCEGCEMGPDGGLQSSCMPM